MTEFLKGAFAGATAEMVETLYEEFLSDWLELTRIRYRALEEAPDIGVYRQFAFETKGHAHNFNHTLLEAVCQRLESYLDSVTDLTGRANSDVARFLEKTMDVLDGTIAPDADASALIRELRARRAAFDVSEIEVTNVEVMLVMLQDAQARFVLREIQACGYRVTIVPSTIEAFGQLIVTKPDFIIVSAMMPGLSGIDFALGVGAMPETRNTPVALITSLPVGHEKLQLLPETMPIIRKSDRFGDDLAEALNSHFLL